MINYTSLLVAFAMAGSLYAMDERPVIEAAEPTLNIAAPSDQVPNQVSMKASSKEAKENNAPPKTTSEQDQNLCKEFTKTLKGAKLPDEITGGVCTVARTRKVPVTIDGVATKSPLVNTALFSFEPGLNLGETAGLDEEISKLEKELIKRDIQITAIHTHWLGTAVKGKPTVLIYMHWKDTTKDPLSFAKATADAWAASLKS